MPLDNQQITRAVECLASGYRGLVRGVNIEVDMMGTTFMVVGQSEPGEMLPAVVTVIDHPNSEEEE